MWREKLVKSKFRNAEFFTARAEKTGGRKTVVHEYPLRDIPYAEDLGRKGHGFTIEAYVLGKDYMDARDALERELDKSGPGTLMHHFRGAIRVQVVEWSVSESTRDGGIAIFSITFTDPGVKDSPTITIDTQAQVDAKATLAVAEVEQSFADRFKVRGYPAFVSDAATGLLTSGYDAILSAGKAISGVAGSIDNFSKDVSDAVSNISTAVNAPGELASSVTNMIATLDSISDSVEGAIYRYKTLFGYGEDLKTVPETTPARKQQAANQSAITGLITKTAIIETARSSSQLDFDSLQNAVSFRDELAAQLDGILQDPNTTDTEYQAVAALYSAMITDINERGANWPRIAEYQPTVTVPALVIAHILYGDALMESDLVSRNNIAHPGFVPGGNPLEVLVNA